MEPRPRHYAADILALPAHERPAALGRVPKHLRRFVLEYIHDTMSIARIVNVAAAKIAKIEQRAERNRALESVPPMFRERVIQIVVEIFKNRARATGASGRSRRPWRPGTQERGGVAAPDHDLVATGLSLGHTARN